MIDVVLERVAEVSRRLGAERRDAPLCSVHLYSSHFAFGARARGIPNIRRWTAFYKACALAVLGLIL